jgi:hypothetical protein
MRWAFLLSWLLQLTLCEKSALPASIPPAKPAGVKIPSEVDGDSKWDQGTATVFRNSIEFATPVICTRNEV